MAKLYSFTLRSKRLKQ